MIHIELTKDEMKRAAVIGAIRQADHISWGSSHKNCTVAKNSEPWRQNIEAAAAELAVWKIVGGTWLGGEPRYVAGQADIVSAKGKLIEVRSVNEEFRELKVREHDADDRYYVGTLVKLPTIVVRGWMLGIDAKRPEWIFNGVPGAKCYCVPTPELRRFLK